MDILRKAFVIIASVGLTTAGTSAFSSAAAAEPTPSSTTTETATAGADMNTDPGSRGSIALLPDTQFYSRYGAEGNNQYAKQYPGIPNPFESQTQWIVNNSGNYGISMTQHLGDVVDQVNHPEQWDAASKAMAIMDEARAPYAIIPGNHDCSDCNPSWTVLPTTAFAEYQQKFPVSRQQTSSSFQSASPSGLSNYHQFTVAGVKMASVNLPWAADDNELDWANKVLEANAHVPTILTTHQLINISPEGDPLSTDYGQHLWDNVIDAHPQIFMTYNGHHHGATNRVLTNSRGLPVFEQLIDYQMAYEGGNGLMSLAEFDFTHGQISQTSFSPWVLQKPKDTVNSYDQALLTDPGATYTYNFDFEKRFRAIGADYHPADNKTQSYTKALRDDINSKFIPVAARESKPAACEADYPRVDGTLAHWRPVKRNDGTAGLDDISGHGNDMVAKSSGGTAQLSDDHSPDSASTASINFQPVSQGDPTATQDVDQHRFSYFETKPDAPLNNETFDRGYTYETFVKIDPKFGEANHWMAFLARQGQRKNLPNLATTDDLDEPPVAGAISSLKEIQWAFTETNQPVEGQSNWSSDVPTDRWLHLTVVDSGPKDGDTGSVVLYVNDIPVLRNTYGPHGLNKDGSKPWMIGGSFYAGLPTNGFFGEIGETRFVDHALAPDQWLDVHQGDGSNCGAATPSDSDVAGESQKPGKPTNVLPAQQPTTATVTIADNPETVNVVPDDERRPSTHHDGDRGIFANTGASILVPLGIALIAVALGSYAIYRER